MTEANYPAATGLPVSADTAPTAVPVESADTGVGKFLQHAVPFVLIGVLLYIGLYAAADQLIYQYGKRNRFFNVKTASSKNYDYVILGASHAAVFDYADMNAKLEEMTGSKIINLSVQGVGPVIERVLLNYFLTSHQTKNVIYFADAFAFNSDEWNEKQFDNVKLFNRAPFDPDLVQVLSQAPSNLMVAWNYLNGFSRINNADRFKPDVDDDEAKFKSVFRPLAQIDRVRIEYLYPKNRDPQAVQRYLNVFEDMITFLKQRNIRLIVLRTPVPLRFYKLLPEEDKFNQQLQALLTKHNVEYHDFSLVDNDEKYFFNSDHLNQAGVLNFYDKHLKQVLTQTPQAVTN